MALRQKSHEDKKITSLKTIINNSSKSQKMSKSIFIYVLLFIATSLEAQVHIGPTAQAPDPSAVLELESGSNKGLLLPRMRKIDMLAIQNPAEGLSVYLTDEKAVHIYNGTEWVKIHGENDAFELPYNGIFNEGTLPVLSLTNSTNGGTGIYGHSSIGAGTGVHGHVFNGGGYGIKGTGKFGRGGYFSSTNSHAIVTDTGSIGFGTLTPTAFVEIDGTKSGATNTMILNDNGTETEIQFRINGVNKSYIKQLEDDLILRPNDNNYAGKVIIQSYNDGGWFFIDAVGNASLGKDPNTFSGTPNNTRMHIKAANEHALTLESPIGGTNIKFYQNFNNALTTVADIKALPTEFNFDHKENYYSWGSTTSPDMELRRSPYFEPLGFCQLGLLGPIGAGTLSPDAALEVINNGGLMPATAIFQDYDPIIYFEDFDNQNNKSFIQLVDDDMKIGTVATNNLGNFVIRTNGGDRVVVRSDGKMVLGSPTGTAPTGTHLLAVKGKIAATEFDVVTVGSWPDYVFDPSYKLKSLEEVESFIKENKHLPNIPAASVIEKEGYGMADMQKKMIEKIEELTLHLIEANKQIKELQQKVNP